MSSNACPSSTDSYRKRWYVVPEVDLMFVVLQIKNLLVGLPAEGMVQKEKKFNGYELIYACKYHHQP